MPFLAAATLDRFLHTIGRAQIFTTQSGAADPSVYAPVEPFDDSMSQSLRELFALPPLPGGGDKAPPKKGKVPGTKDLARFFKLSKEPSTGSEAPQWLAGTRALVLAGALKSDKDFELAARTLLGSSDAADLLSAHVLAMCALLRGKSGAPRALAAETLDRFLRSIGRPASFGTPAADGAAREHSALPDFILREYGLGASQKR